MRNPVPSGYAGSLAVFGLEAEREGCPRRATFLIQPDVRQKRRVRIVVAVFVLTTALAHSAAGQVVTEYPIPTANSGPFGIVTGPDGNLWFAESYSLGNKIGRMTTAGVVNEFTIPTAGCGPLEITNGPDGNLWFAESNCNKIGRITTAGSIMEFGGLTANSQPTGITAGPDGNLWFVEHLIGKVGRITTAGVVTEFSIPTAGSEPISITHGPDGNLWFTEQVGKIGRITTTGTITEFPVPTPSSNPGGIAAGPDGNLWFAEGALQIGRITTAGTVTEFPVNTGNPLRGITAGPDGNMWFTDIGDRVGKITMAGQVREFNVLTSVATPYLITPGPDGALWFTELNASQIGRITTSARFFTVTPCRVADTRNPPGPYGGPALFAKTNRTFVIGGQCGIPATATAVSFNFTATQPDVGGDLRVFPAGGGLPLVSTLNWSAAQTRANNAVVALGLSADVTVHLDQPTGTVQLIIDATGYFQ